MKRQTLQLVALMLGPAVALSCAYVRSSRSAANQNAQAVASSTPDIPFVPFCDLVRNPVAYDQKTIRVKAILSVGKDTRTLWDTDCDNKDSYVSGECFHPPEKTCEKISEALDKYRGGEKGRWLGGNTLVDVVCQFYANSENGQRHRLEMLEVKDAKAMDTIRHRP
ncbi:MAG: hypothetical protein ACREA9_08060 [Pyrinomonadaceae bacterium]